MAQNATFTIDSIQGNSYIGVPVFSRFGQMQNYNYIVMSPQKKLKEREEKDNNIIDPENMKFKLMPAEDTNQMQQVQQQKKKEEASKNDK